GTTSTTWDNYSFSGTFDGAGNTLTFDYSTNVGTEGLIAPFRFVDGATIKNLVVDGTIVTTNLYAAGIIGRVDGNTALTNCRSSVIINSSVVDDGRHGGLIGLIRGDANATITGCLFDGKMITFNVGDVGATNHCGGLVGETFYDGTYSASVSIVNSLYASAELAEGEISVDAFYSSTLARYTNDNQATITNSYYMQALGTGQGKQALSISGGENVIVENAGTVTEYDVSGIISYGTGIGHTTIILSEEEEDEVVTLYAGDGDNVNLNLSCILPEGYVLHGFQVNAGTLEGSEDAYTLTMPDEDVVITADVTIEYIIREIEGYGNGDGGYVLIASPIGTVDPQDVTHMLENAYDLYAFNQAENEEWRNYEANAFDLESGKGYLYANSEDVTLVFSGTPYSGNSDVTLSKTSGGNFEGWNLVGNPFNEIAYIEDGRSFYTMNGEGSEIIAATNPSIEAMEGVFVIADEDGETITFTTEEPNQSKSMLALNLSKGSGVIDRAIVRFGEGSLLPKFQMKNNSTKIYFQQDNKDYAVVNASRDVARNVSTTEMPVSFKAKENGTYMLSLCNKEVAFTYLHLIDNLTGNDIDLLQTPSYTFDSKITDYESRFKLVFRVDEDNSDNNDNFAYISNGNLIVTGITDNSVLQIIDLTGRVLISRSASNPISTNGLTAGVYVLRLIDGEKVRTQKIVIQ
nr:T9SS type A sorting domain-containing protein [Bacteroidales bacterium]